MTAKEIAANADLTASAHDLLRDDSTPATFLDALEKQQLYEDAIRFQAHKLTPANGVKWALSCMQDLGDPAKKSEPNPARDACDTWTKAPTDATRWAARDAAAKERTTTPAGVLAHAVFFSGGSITPPGSPETQPPPGSAQKLIAGAIQITILTHEPQHAPDRYRKALSLGRLL